MRHSTPSVSPVITISVFCIHCLRRLLVFWWTLDQSRQQRSMPDCDKTPFWELRDLHCRRCVQKDRLSGAQAGFAIVDGRKLAAAAGGDIRNAELIRHVETHPSGKNVCRPSRVRRQAAGEAPRIVRTGTPCEDE